jgi:hypothetical protein
MYPMPSFPKGRKLNAEDDRNNILTTVIPLHPEAGGRKPVVHRDNVTVHTAQKCITLLQRTGYS